MPESLTGSRVLPGLSDHQRSLLRALGHGMGGLSQLSQLSFTFPLHRQVVSRARAHGRALACMQWGSEQQLRQ